MFAHIVQRIVTNELINNKKNSTTYFQAKFMGYLTQRGTYSACSSQGVKNQAHSGSCSAVYRKWS